MLPITPMFQDRQALQSSELARTDSPAHQAGTLPRPPSIPLALQALSRVSIDRNSAPGGITRSPSRGSLGAVGALAAAFAGPAARAGHEQLDASSLPDAREPLDAQFGAETVESRLRHDVFADLAALKRQLTHESKTEITLDEYHRIEPLGGPAGQGVPPGWHLEDRITRDAGGLTKMRSTLTGPNGESGMIVRSFDGRTLYLDKAYKSTLPTRMTGVPGFDRPVTTINYLTARACRILGVTPENLQYIKVNRLQHKPALAHLDWLQRKYPESSMADLIQHTTWARSYIRETAAILGHAVQAAPAIDLEDGAAWSKAHPGAARRDWDYMTMETERLTIKHLTGQKLSRVDDASGDWRVSAEQALARFKAQRCTGLAEPETAALEADIDSRLTRRLDAIRLEDHALRTRYELPFGTAPRHVNFDVTFRTAPHEV